MHACVDSESMFWTFPVLLKHKISKQYDMKGFEAETLERFRVIGHLLPIWILLSFLSCCLIPFTVKEVLCDKTFRAAIDISLILFSFSGLIITIISMLMFKTGHCCFAKVSILKPTFLYNPENRPCYVLYMKSDVFPQNFFYTVIVKPEVYEEMKDKDIYLAYLNHSVLGFVY